MRPFGRARCSVFAIACASFRPERGIHRGRFPGRSHARRPRTILPLLAMLAVEPGLALPPRCSQRSAPRGGAAAHRRCRLAADRALNVGEDVLTARYQINVRINLAARRIQTQVLVLRRMAITVIGMVALSSMLMDVSHHLEHRRGALRLRRSGRTGDRRSMRPGRRSRTCWPESESPLPNRCGLTM